MTEGILEETLLSGSLFLEIYGNETYYLLTDEYDENEGQYIGDDDLYTNLEKELTIENNFLDGGFEIINSNDLYTYLEDKMYCCMYLHRVIVLKDSQVFISSNGTIRVNLILLTSREDISELEIWKDKDECMNIISLHPELVMYMDNYTDEVYKAALDIKSSVIKNIINQSLELCEYAIKMDINTLEYLRHQTDEICEIALSKNGMLLEFIRDQTIEHCKLAIKTSPEDIQYCKYQTDELCIEAVKRDSRVIRHIENPCIEAILISVSDDERNIIYIEGDDMILMSAAIVNPLIIRYMKSKRMRDMAIKFLREKIDY